MGRKGDQGLRPSLTQRALRKNNLRAAIFDYLCALGVRIILHLQLRKVKAIKVHHFVPGGDEIMHEFLLCIGAGIDFRQRAEHGV